VSYRQKNMTLIIMMMIIIYELMIFVQCPWTPFTRKHVFAYCMMMIIIIITL